MSESDSKPTEIVVAKRRSNNPNGRPRKGCAVADVYRRGIINEDRLAIIKKQVAKALEGDWFSAKIILDREWPAPRPVEQPVILRLPADSSLTEQGEALMQATARGEVAPSHAAALMMGLNSQANVMKIDELARRVAGLEKSNGKRP